jgi:lipopolysaccharide assembly outer membrane protein LptD (OstA)
MINDTFPEFSDLSASLRFKPIKDFSLNVSVSYNYFIEDFTRITAKISYDNEKSLLNGYLSYSNNRNAYTSADYFFNREIVSGLVNVNVQGFPLELSSDINYDITEKEFRSASFKAILDYQCVIINAEFKIFSYLGREETQFNIGVSFGNLGMVSNFLSEGEN